MKKITAAFILLLSYVGPTAAQGITVAVNTSDEFTTAVWNTSVSTITVLKDIKLADVLRQRWTENYVLTRNLTIMGAIGSYPAIDINYGRTDGGLSLNYTGKPDAKGIMIGAGITLTFKRIIIKRSVYLVPEFIVGGQDPITSFAYFEDCAIHRYTFVGDPSYSMNLYLNRFRPAWNGPYPNYGAVLPEGYCRTAPDPAKCWQYSFMIWDYAEDWSAFGLFPVFRAAMRSTPVVSESVIDAECYDQFFKGNRTCFLVAVLALQQQEAAQGGFWLGPPPTQQQIDNAAAGLVEAQLEYAQMLADRDNPKANHSKRVHIGIAVGASIGGLAILLSMAAIQILKRRQLRAATSTQDIESSGNKALSSIPENNIGSTSDSEKLVVPLQPAVLLLSNQSTMKCDTQTDSLAMTGSCLTPASDNDTHLSIHSELKQMEMQAEASSSQPSSLHQVDDDHTIITPTGRLQVSETTSPRDGPNLLLQTQTSVATSPMPAVLAHDTNVTDTLWLSKVITPATSFPDTILTDVQFGSDVILGRKLGSGAMGTVYEATFRDTPVAVKLLSPGADLKSFEHELGILGRTRHPNVIRLLAANLTSSSQPLLVEELAHGSLERLLYPPLQDLDANPMTSHLTPGSLPVLPTPLPMSVVLSLALDIASGLAYLHPTILHRDLKPANVLLLCASRSAMTGPVSSVTVDVANEDFREEIGTSDTADISQAVHQPGLAGEQCHALHAKISDFGLSRMIDAMTVMTQKPHCGTLPYMAPECFSRERPAGLTHKCDIYSFGILLWEMLHGARPWYGCTPVQIVYEVMINRARPPIIEDETRCPRQLRKLIMRCWDADPYRRPPALEVARELALIQRQLGCVNVTATAGAVPQ